MRTRVEAEAKVSNSYAKEEVAADIMSVLMRDTGGLSRLANENKTVLERLINVAERFLSDIKGNSTEAKALRNEAEALVDRMYRAQGGGDKSRFSVENRTNQDYNVNEETKYSEKDGEKGAGRESYRTSGTVSEGSRNAENTGRGEGIRGETLGSGVPISDTQGREIGEVIAEAVDRTSEGREIIRTRGLSRIINDVTSVLAISPEFDTLLTEAYPGLTLSDISRIREITKSTKKLIAKKTLTANDRAYFDALNTDKSKAEQMVREAAEQAGYKLHQFHLDSLSKQFDSYSDSIEVDRAVFLAVRPILLRLFCVHFSSVKGKNKGKLTSRKQKRTL